MSNRIRLCSELASFLVQICIVASLFSFLSGTSGHYDCCIQLTSLQLYGRGDGAAGKSGCSQLHAEFTLASSPCVVRSSAGCFVKIYRVNICNFFSSLFGVTSNPYRRVIPIKSNPYRRVIPVKSNPHIRVISV